MKELVYIINLIFILLINFSRDVLSLGKKLFAISIRYSRSNIGRKWRQFDQRVGQ